MEIPGFIDLQVNGYIGVDFSSPELTEEGFIYASKELIRQGTVGFLPTIITSSEQIYKRNLGIISGCMNRKELSKHLLGIHLEGPFISGKEGVVGAHNPKWVRKPDVKFLNDLYQWSEGNLKMLTIAAELEGSEALCSHATGLGISVSLGHQYATESDLNTLASSGAVSLTHLGNGLPAMLPRHKNPIWAGLANDDLKAMIITDGHHIPASIIKIILRTKGISNSVVVSDASPIAGLPPGRYNTLGNVAVLEPSGYLYNPDTGYMVGSSSTMMDCMNFLSSLNLVTSEELLQLGFYNPLRLIGTDPSKVMACPSSIFQEAGKFHLLIEGTSSE